MLCVLGECISDGWVVAVEHSNNRRQSFVVAVECKYTDI